MKTLSSVNRFVIVSVIMGTALAFWSCNSTRQTLTSADQPQTPVGEYRITGPYVHENLAVFLIHGADKLKGKSFLTLQEAMEQKLVVVNETGSVNELSIENLSDKDIYVQSGDIVKGGRQDRTFAFDVIVPPKSGVMPIAAFCVESGRWSKRGNESDAAFGANTAILPSKELKMAAKGGGSAGGASAGGQNVVWGNVETLGGSLSQAAARIVAGNGTMNWVNAGTVQSVGGVVLNNAAGGSVTLTAGNQSLTVSGGTMTFAGNLTNMGNLPLSGPGGSFTMTGGVLAANGGSISVADPASPSSLQLTLENKAVQEATDAYIKKLSSIIDGKKDVIGFAFAINGKMNSADIYGSHELFVKLWPKLLRASATEALANYKKDAKFAAVTTDAVTLCLQDAERGKATDKEVSPRVRMTTRETDKNTQFDTFDRAMPSVPIHKNVLTH